MPGRRRKAGGITARDRDIFRFLYESKVATSRQIRARFFPKVSLTFANRRLRLLSKAGWIERAGFTENSDSLTYLLSLTDAAYRQFVRKEGVNDLRCQLRSDAVDHDVALVDIRGRLENLPMVNRLYTENLLQSCYDYAESDEFKDYVTLHSDALLEVNFQDEHRFLVPLEYEASLKSKDRCRSKLLDYYVKSDAQAVFFICGSKPVLDRMTEIEGEIGQEFRPKVYFSLLSNVINPAEKVTFTSIQGKSITIE